MKSRIPTEEFGSLDFPTFSTVQHPSRSTSQGFLTSPVYKTILIYGVKNTEQQHGCVRYLRIKETQCGM
jgi:hypothetical protein